MNASVLLKCAAAAAAGAACLQGPLAAQQPAGVPRRSEIRTDHGVVAAGRTFAAGAGTQMLTTGGNAIDAGSTGVVAAGVDPATGRLRGGADPRRERALIAC